MTNQLKPLSLRELAALWLCKAARCALRLTKHGGTNFPGKLAVRIAPALLGKLAQNVFVVCVSGTNGKTTTCRMIEEGFQRAGKRYFANRSGANLLAGITAEFAAHSNLFGRSRCECAVIECDELAAKKAFSLLNPQIITVTNLFRDQLDRCGEVSHTLAALREAIALSPRAVLCLNADDSLVRSLADEAKQGVCFFGMSAPFEAGAGEAELSDARYCIRCRTAYAYDYVTYAHLGAYRCPRCGYCRPEAQVCAEYLGGDEYGSRIRLSLHGQAQEVRIPIPAYYNVYNALAASAALSTAGYAIAEICETLEHCRCGFGRMEEFDLGCRVQMMLVKNPAGCNQVLHYLKTLSERHAMVFCLNDKLADGTDISWIWDADFELLADCGEKISRIYLCGTRAEELLIRMKYAGVDVENAVVSHDYEAVLDALAENGENTVIVPTYTAMMELRPLLVKRAGGKAFWE